MSFSRRQFCKTFGAGLSMGNANIFADAPKSNPLRVIAYNIFGLTGWPAQRRLAQQAVASGQIVKQLTRELTLHQPDIINFSESPSAEKTKEVAELLGMHHVRFNSGGNWPGTLLSKFEIIDSQSAPMIGDSPKELFTRHWGRATLQFPGEERLIVHSAHLYPTADPTIRLREIRAMIASMKQDLDAGRSMLLMGDLNHGPDSEEYRLWMEAGWVDTFIKVGKGRGFTFRSDIPKWRIDYVMAYGPIAQRAVESRPLFEGAFRLRITNRESFALSDHAPHLAVFRQAGPS